ncbi:MAG TPA: DUF169 domain-containing protein [Candidatus Heimdallarchaeota archaeon]|nr:DUF169 domain-containing protein [Candidatus Heimdallarchaeota archaeon]
MKDEQPNPDILVQRIDLKIPLIGFYDAPDPQPFAPNVIPKPGECVFSFYENWLRGETLHITKDHYGCGGVGRWMCGITTRPREAFIKFLVDDEGLKSSHALMEQWIDSRSPFQASHPHLLVGPLKEDQWAHAKSITFFVDPDQLSTLMLGAQYESSPENPPSVIAPFGSGCMELLPFDDPNIPQAAISTTDIAMRQYIPRKILGFTVTKSMFERLCSLDKRSFLYKPFLQRLRKARDLPDI